MADSCFSFGCETYVEDTTIIQRLGINATTVNKLGLVEQARTVNPFEIALSDCTAPSFASTQGAVQTYREGFFSFDPTNWCIMVYAQR